MPLVASAAGHASVTSSRSDSASGGAAVDHAHDEPHHARDDAFAIGCRQRLAERQVDAEAAGDFPRRLLDPHQALVGFLDDQPAADRDGRGGEDLALLDQRELGGAAADVDVEKCRAVTARQRDGAGAVRRHLAFHVVAGRGADEPAGFLREQIGDRARIVPLDRLAGEDDRAAVDVGGLEVGIVGSSRR